MVKYFLNLVLLLFWLSTAGAAQQLIQDSDFSAQPDYTPDYGVATGVWAGSSAETDGGLGQAQWSANETLLYSGPLHEFNGLQVELLLRIPGPAVGSLNWSVVDSGGVTHSGAANFANIDFTNPAGPTYTAVFTPAQGTAMANLSITSAAGSGQWEVGLVQFNQTLVPEIDANSGALPVAILLTVLFIVFDSRRRFSLSA